MVQYSATTKYHEFLGAVTQHAAEGILAYSRSGKVILANNALGKIFGVDSLDIERQNLIDLIPDTEDKENILTRLFLRSTSQQEEAFEFTILQATGNLLPVDVMVGYTKLSDGEEVFIANWRDISERRKTEERLVRQAEIINQMHDAILVADPDFRVMECNKALEHILHIPKAKLLGKNLYDLVHTQFPGDMKPEDVWEIAVSKGRWHGIVGVTNSVGALVQMDCVLFPMRDSKDEISYFISVARDITERLETERRIQETQRIESLGRLAGGVAHDINNLLFPIFLNLEEAADDVEAGTDLEEAVTAIRASMDACMKIKQMIEQILHFSRDNTEREEVLDMAVVVQEAWKLTKMIIPSSLKTEVSIQGASGYMLGNAIQLSQILLNLVSNAVAAIAQGPGLISITLEQKRADDIAKPRYYAIRHEMYAVLSVTDTGCGIPKNIMGRILDPFFTTKGVGEGTGLGLTEVAGIVRDYDGAININSKVGQGTTISIYFPVSSALETKVI
ncbi:PAS domain-containing sensor histidine kinase [Kordiimonas pumila]|uniref:histidine kinase n=1 Tax=Kordiimonas pumila TaxID=2161677 RepID=A0ABV7D677_9PROT|nr:PAS domain-containing sensor histidine kinase [Kordiimonas pumila]